MFTDESFEKKAESPARMSQDDLLEFFNSLKPKEEVLIWYDSGIRRADDWTPMTVGRRSESKKYNLKKVSLTGKHGGKFILYNRQGKISLAMGGMATVLVAAKKKGSFGAETFGAEDSTIQHGDMVESWAGVGRVDYIRGDKAKIRLQDGSRSKFLNISGLKKVKNAETFEATDVRKRMKCRGCGQWEFVRGVAMNNFLQDDKGKWRCYDCLYDKPKHKVVVIGKGKHKPFGAENEESCMICSKPPVLRTQWGHTVCGDDDCRKRAMRMISMEDVVCDCNGTMKPIGDGYYECKSCYDNQYIGDVEFGAETFGAESSKGN
jgi:hypothetical protein